MFFHVLSMSFYAMLARANIVQTRTDNTIVTRRIGQLHASHLQRQQWSADVPGREVKPFFVTTLYQSTGSWCFVSTCSFNIGHVWKLLSDLFWHFCNLNECEACLGTVLRGTTPKLQSIMGLCQCQWNEPCRAFRMILILWCRAAKKIQMKFGMIPCTRKTDYVWLGPNFELSMLVSKWVCLTPWPQQPTDLRCPEIQPLSLLYLSP